MQFSRLRLAGFKSFVEPTEIHIEPGLTGVVGPNGCGKSNLVEALRWVMGESSAKQMRGGEMDDVIFGGTADRPARNLAEVILSLDNSDREAPSQFNEASEIDVVRRIERGSGSQYKVNGREVRARDVQLLFADAASGARSTALVSQGRIGAIINAKPADRRHLLEEAAGITGLHSRRHDAELRLRAAEGNLERLDDVIVALEEQLRTLKRQARQATRYRNLSDRIRKAEAVVLHSRWTEAVAARQAAVNDLRQSEDLVSETTRVVARISARQADASGGLPELRKSEAEAAAALQRLLVARDALDAEEKRLEAARAAIETRLSQIDGDVERERTVQGDAVEAATRLEAEAKTLTSDQAGEADEIAASNARLGESQTQVSGIEEQLNRLTRDVAAEEAREAALMRRIADLESRRARLAQRREDVERERTELAEQSGDSQELEAAGAEVATASAALDTAGEDHETADQARVAAQAVETERRDALQAADSDAARLRAEVSALTELVKVGDPDLFPPMIDAVTVAPGYELALGAALGDDLTAPLDDSAPIHWRELPAMEVAPDLPSGVRPLSDVVEAPQALARRLSQIGVVEDDSTGNDLRPQLAQGQRLVSREGGLWRWDGYTAASGAPTPAAVRLTQANRLTDLRDELAAAELKASQSREHFEVAHSAAAQANETERGARSASREADRRLQQARESESAIVRASSQARSRVEALAETASRLEADLVDASNLFDEAQSEISSLPDLAERRTEIETMRDDLGERRGNLETNRNCHDELLRGVESRRLRLAATQKELTSWNDRAENATHQLAQLAERRAQAEEETSQLLARPLEIETQRSALLDQISEAERTRNKAADALAEAETRLEEIGRELRSHESVLSDQREERVRRQGLVEQAEQGMTALTERIRERLKCAPDRILATAGLSEDEERPDREAMETRLERLLRERDNMGPVNLRAEAEAAELDERIATMQSEREDLVGAISRLRQGIGGLNREGRERLLGAFKEVDNHFRELFTRLFGGGRAHLALTEAEDPLDAGLEVMASPPGKRLQTMSLLSGGEQALAALALLFAVFMTNPAPICVLDEVDAPLDDHNVDRFCDLLQDIANRSSTRFLLITHHRLTMARMDRLYGVTMAERGVSQLVSVDLATADEIRDIA